MQGRDQAEDVLAAVQPGEQILRPGDKQNYIIQRAAEMLRLPCPEWIKSNMDELDH